MYVYTIHFTGVFIRVFLSPRLQTVQTQPAPHTRLSSLIMCSVIPAPAAASANSEKHAAAV